MNAMLAWHFTEECLHDGRPLPETGVWLVHDGEIKICHTGLHASEILIDALKFAPGENLHRVECRGIEDREFDNLVCRERRILWSIDADDTLGAFSRRVALDVAHLWDMPPIVQEYLETGRDDLRAAASAAAWAATRTTAGVGHAAASAAGWATTRAALAAPRAGASAGYAAYTAADPDAAFRKYSEWLTEMIEAAHAAELVKE